MSDNEPEKLDLRSHAIAEDKRQELLRLFPEIRTEGGKLDFDRLKLALGEAVDIGKERYGLTWPGKAECFKAIQTPSLGTLRPVPEKSLNFDTTENLIIEGDNLEVLKLLQKSYLGKVKMIYIDPPYNTGNDFIYPDNYTEMLQTYLEYTGQVDAEGKKFGTNTEAEGRFHTKWLNMIYPRLYLARNLLRDDGVMFISIDDGEVDNLRKVCAELFGEENFVGMITRSTGTPTGGGFDVLANIVDYILVFSRSSDFGLQGLTLNDSQAAIYDQQDEKGKYLTRSLRRTGGEDRREDRPSMYYAISAPDGTDVYPIGPGGYESRWRCGPKKYQELKREGLIEWKQVKEDGRQSWKPYQKFYLEGRKKQPSNLWDDVEGNKKATRDLKELLGDKVFDSPKPTELIARCIGVAGDEDAIVLDFFAGSGTTGEAVLRLNNEDGGARRFVLVQLPEPTGRDDYKTIADICEERIRKVSQREKEHVAGKLDVDAAANQDRGFRVFKLAESNFKTWEAGTPNDAETLGTQLELHVQHIREGRLDADVLFEILLKSGYTLTTPVETLSLGGKTVHSAQGGALLVCLERELTLELIRAIAERKPERVVCLDAGFAGNDQLKANAVQIFKANCVTSFKTV